MALCWCLLGCSRGAHYYVDRGNRLYSEGKYQEAVLNYRNSIKKEPNFAEAHYRLARAEWKQGNGPEAFQEFQRAVNLAPDREDFRVDLADLALTSYSSDPRRPKVLYDHVHNTADYLLRKDPNSIDGLRFRGDALSIDGKYEEAMAVFRRANSLKPLEPKVVLPMVQILFSQNQPLEGETLAQKCIQSHKDAESVYEVLYNHYIKTNRLPEAETLLKAKIANLPKDPNPILELAAFYSQHHQESAMSQVLQGIFARPHDFPRGHEVVGDFYAANGRWDDALREYRQELKADSKKDQKQSDRKRIAKALIAKGKRDEAIEQLNLVLDAGAEDEDARLARAILLRDAREPAKLATAINEMNALLAKNPSDETARYNLGLAYLAEGDLKAAHTQLVASARVRRDYIPPRITLAEMAQKARNYSECVRYSEEVLAVDPENSTARFWHAAGLIGDKAFIRARAELDAILRRYPDSADANLHMAVLNTSEKRFRDAEAIYLRFYKPGQQDLRPLEGLIQLYLAEGRPDKSLNLLEDEIKKAPDSRPAHLLLATAAARAGKLDLAIQQYEWLRSNDPKSVEVYTSLGDIYRLKGDFNSSLASYQKAQEIAPNDPKVAAVIAYLEASAGQTKDAIANLQRQVSKDPEDMIAINNLAFLLAETGTDLDQAQSLAEKAQRKDPNNPGIADTLGWVYAKKGLSDSAAQIYRNLVRKYPNDPAFRYHFGVALLQQGKRAEARTQFDLSLSNKPPKDIAEKIREIVARMG